MHKSLFIFYFSPRRRTLFVWLLFSIALLYHVRLILQYRLSLVNMGALILS